MIPIRKRSLLLNLIDVAVRKLCAPLYIVFLPGAWIYEHLLPLRKIDVGLTAYHKLGKGFRDEYLVTDVSLLSDGLVGIRKRRRNLLGPLAPPPWSENVDFVTVDNFWHPPTAEI